MGIISTMHPVMRLDASDVRVTDRLGFRTPTLAAIPCLYRVHTRGICDQCFSELGIACYLPGCLYVRPFIPHFLQGF